jgi:hypothetical protein
VSVKRGGPANAEKLPMIFLHVTTKMARRPNPSAHLRNTYIALIMISNLYCLNRRVVRAPDCLKCDRFHLSDVSLYSAMALVQADLSATRSPSQISALKIPSCATSPTYRLANFIPTPRPQYPHAPQISASIPDSVPLPTRPKNKRQGC